MQGCIKFFSLIKLRDMSHCEDQQDIFILSDITAPLLIKGWLNNDETPQQILNIQLISQIILYYFWGLHGLDFWACVWHSGSVKIQIASRRIINEADIENVYFKFNKRIILDEIWRYDLILKHMKKTFVVGVVDNTSELCPNWFSVSDKGFGIAVNNGFCVTALPNHRHLQSYSMIGSRVPYIPSHKLSSNNNEIKLSIIVNRYEHFVKYIIDNEDYGIAYYLPTEETESYSVAISMTAKHQQIILGQNIPLNCSAKVVLLTIPEREIIAKFSDYETRNMSINYKKRLGLYSLKKFRSSRSSRSRIRYHKFRVYVINNLYVKYVQIIC